MSARAAVDVLVAGGGNAALCAAIAARRAGASVLVVEAAPRFYRGGNTRHTRNMRCAHDTATEHLTGPYTEDEFWDDLLRVTGGNTDEQLARYMIAQSKPMLGWIGEQGVRFQPSLGGTHSLGRTNSFFLGGGRAMLNALYLTAETLGIDVLYESPVVALDIANGRFRSATLRTPEGDRVVHARALVAAAGGFESNIDWLREGWGEIAENFLIRGTPYNRGDVLKMLMGAGVETIGDPTQCHAVAIDARAPKFDGGIITRLDCVVFGIVVSRDAQRFYDEGEDVWPKRYAIWGRLVAQQPDQIAWIIFDASSLDMFMPSLYPPIAAQSVGELAAKLDLPADALKKTVGDFNAAVRPGTFDHTVLDDCRTEGLTPPKSHWARRIETPPFYAYPVRPGITFTYLCTRVDRDARMRMRGGGGADNMFAAGEIMAGNVLGAGYAAGMGMTIGSVFGKIAGEGAARHARADHYEEAARLMTICNSCRYCEGLCAVFPAMELRRSFANAELDYLANLCHGCGACYVDCQFSPPHEFDVNVPTTLAEVRAASYRSYAWPAFLRPMFDRNGLAIAAVTAASVAAFILSFALAHDRSALFTQDGHFYRLMPHNAMAGLFGAVFLFAVVALIMGFRSFWQEIGARSVAAGSGTTLWRAGRDAATLRYLGWWRGGLLQRR